MTSRRVWLQQGVGAVALFATPLTWAAMPQRILDIVADDLSAPTPQLGKVEVTLPALSENGNSVALKVAVDHPMNPDSYVREIAVFAEKNPLPNVLRCQLTPRLARAEVNTRIRLADSQSIVAVATLSDGSVWYGAADVVVTIAACIDVTL